MGGHRLSCCNEYEKEENIFIAKLFLIVTTNYNLSKPPTTINNNNLKSNVQRIRCRWCWFPAVRIVLIASLCLGLALSTCTSIWSSELWTLWRNRFSWFSPTWRPCVALSKENLWYQQFVSAEIVMINRERKREEVEKVSEMNNTSIREFEKRVSVQEEKIDFFVVVPQQGFAQKIPNSKSILAKDTRRDSRFVRIEKVSFFEALLSRYKSSILIGAILPARRLSPSAARHPISRPSSEKRRLIINRAYSLSRARYSWKLNAAWIAPHSAFCARCDHHNTETTTRKQQQGIKRTMFMKLLVVSVKKTEGCTVR